MSQLTKKVLVAVDGSKNSARAVDQVIDWAKSGFADEVHLVNVQYAVPRAVSTFVGRKAVSGYHHEEGEKAVASAKEKLEAEKIAFNVHIGVGPPGETIARFAEDLGVDAIVMGTRGLGGTAGLLLGSVTRDVISETKLPVVLIK
jgi:nucleotide-binding universal stress UspA family protein